MKNQRIAQENTFRTHDDVDLFYRHWPATGRGAAPSSCSIAATSIPDATRISSMN
jgi:alpha-beta hydrolase superfamily lysophospholipase